MPADDEGRNEGDLPDLIRALRDNEPWAAMRVYQQYAGDLRRIADGKIEPFLKRRMDADDVLQSAFRTFFRRVQNGQLQVDDSMQLWNLLCAITLTKVREQARFHLRAKRGVDRLPPTIELGSDDSHPPPAEPAISSRIVYQQIDFADQMEQLMEALDDEESAIITLKLSEFTNRQIAGKLSMSERTVRRILGRLRARFERELS